MKLFKTRLSMDQVHVKAISTFRDINEKKIKEDYSPNFYNLELVLEIHKTLEGFYGSFYDPSRALIMFPKDILEPVIVFYTIKQYNHEEISNTTTFEIPEESLVITLAPQSVYKNLDFNIKKPEKKK